MPINLKGSGILDADGDILTRSGGSPAGITRAALAADAAFTGTFVEKSEANTDSFRTLIGNRTTAAGADAQVAFEVAANFSDSDDVVTQAVSFYALFSGTPGATQGTYQGGSSGVTGYTDAAITQAALGFEGIADAAGDGSMSSVTGLQGTAFAAGNVGVDALVSVCAAGPFAASGSPAVAEAMSLRGLEPIVGTQRYTAHLTGRTRLAKGTHANVLEIASGGGALQWASDGSLLTGYAEDAASYKVILNPTAGAVRITTRSLTSFGDAGQAFSHETDFAESFRITGAGLLKWSAAGNQQTTVGAAGGASALPATPTKYLKVVDSAGTVLVVPAYAAS